LSGFDFKIEFQPGKEGGKPDALTRRREDMPQEGDDRLTQKERILLPKEKYDEGLEQAVANWAKQAHYPRRAVRVSQRTMEKGIAACALSARP